MSNVLVLMREGRHCRRLLCKVWSLLSESHPAGREFQWWVAEPLWEADVLCPLALLHSCDGSECGGLSPGPSSVLSVRSHTSSALVTVRSCTDLAFTGKDSLVLKTSLVKEHNSFSLIFPFLSSPFPTVTIR